MPTITDASGSEREAAFGGRQRAIALRIGSRSRLSSAACSMLSIPISISPNSSRTVPPEGVHRQAKAKRRRQLEVVQSQNSPLQQGSHGAPSSKPPSFVTAALKQSTGKTFIVDNRGGASGNMRMEYAGRHRLRGRI